MVKSRGHTIRRLRRFGTNSVRERRLTALHPFAGCERYGVHNNSNVNIERALVERVFTVAGDLPPAPNRQLLMGRLLRFTAKLTRHVDPVAEMSTNQFVDTYVGRKKLMYQRAVDSLLEKPVCADDAIVSSFIKDEKTNLTRKGDPCPRIIQPRSPRFNVSIGVYLKPLEKAIFRGIAAVFRDVTVLKGYNAVERASILRRKWDRFDRPVALLLDAKRFDQHVSRDLLDWEQSTFSRLLLNPIGFQSVNKLRRRNVCYARSGDSGFAYTLNGIRMSGDMDTALGNCLSMCAMTWSFMTDLGVQKYSYGNDGDDGVLIFEEEHLDMILERFEGYFRDFGFTMKLEGVARVFEHVDFCQARPVWDGKGWRMVRNPDVALMKDSMTLSKLPPKEIANAVGWGGVALCGTIPICGKFYQSLINSNAVRPQELTCGRDFLAYRLAFEVGEPTVQSRVSFYEAFGISPDQQIAIEHTIQPWLPSYHNPALVESFSGGSTMRWWY